MLLHWTSAILYITIQVHSIDCDSVQITAAKIGREMPHGSGRCKRFQQVHQPAQPHQQDKMLADITMDQGVCVLGLEKREWC